MFMINSIINLHILPPEAREIIIKMIFYFKMIILIIILAFLIFFYQFTRNDLEF